MEALCSVYILKSLISGNFYIGSSKDPVHREYKHNTGNTKSTRNKGPWKLVFNQIFPNITIARKMENKLKKMKNKNILSQIVKDGKIKAKL